jgi:hypothetical protein
MKRLAILLPFCLSAFACGPSTSVEPEDESLADEFIGGWDAEGSGGAAILLLRDGLLGTLNVSSLEGREQQFHIVFDVAGDLEDDTLTLNLNCSEARERSLGSSDEPSPEPPDVPDTDGVDEGEGDRSDDDDDDEWSAVDCSGWDLALSCDLAGECGTSDCNMVCDVVYFGDAYAHSQIELGSVEDAFDYWQRV